MQQNEAAGMRAAAAASELQLQAAGEAEQHEEQSRRLRDSCAFTLRSHASLVLPFWDGFFMFLRHMEGFAFFGKIIFS